MGVMKEKQKIGPRTQVQRKEESELRLVVAAREVLARKGWVGMTLADVGQLAGVSRGLASHHFGNKAGLLRALTLHINLSFEKEMKAAPPAKGGLEAILGYVSVYLGRADKKWTNTRTLLLLMAEALIENSENSEVLAVYMQRMFGYLAENIRIGIVQGEINADISPEVGAEMIIGALRGMMLQRLIKGGDINVTEMGCHVLQMIKRAFSTARL